MLSIYFSTLSPFSSIHIIQQCSKSIIRCTTLLPPFYGEAALSERTCREWFQRFKSGDFDVEDRNTGRKENIFGDFELEAFLVED